MGMGIGMSLEQLLRLKVNEAAIEAVLDAELIYPFPLSEGRMGYVVVKGTFTTEQAERMRKVLMVLSEDVPEVGPDG